MKKLTQKLLEKITKKIYSKIIKNNVHSFKWLKNVSNILVKKIDQLKVDKKELIANFFFEKESEGSYFIFWRDYLYIH